MPEPPIMPRTAFAMIFPSSRTIVKEPLHTGKVRLFAVFRRIFARSRFRSEYVLVRIRNSPIHMPVPASAAKSGTAPDALSVLNHVFGLPGFRGAQEEIVRHVTEGGNCLVLMPTGGGKSLCYQLPSLL